MIIGAIEIAAKSVLCKDPPKTRSAKTAKEIRVRVIAILGR